MLLKEELSKILPTDFADDSRIWIYQSSRPFSEREIVEIDDQLHHFYVQWKSHDMPVKGWAKVILDRFVVLMADESQVGLGGCSMDDSQRVIKSLERQYQVTLFDRLTLTFYLNEKIEQLPLNQVQYALDNNFIKPDSLLFNNLVATKKDFLNSWLIPLQHSWLAKRVMLAV